MNIKHDEEKKIVTVFLPMGWEIRCITVPHEYDFKLLKLPYLVGSIGKIQAIKEVRTITGWGLKESKDEVDSWSR